MVQIESVVAGVDNHQDMEDSYYNSIAVVKETPYLMDCYHWEDCIFRSYMVVVVVAVFVDKEDIAEAFLRPVKDYELLIKFLLILLVLIK